MPPFLFFLLFLLISEKSTESTITAPIHKDQSTNLYTLTLQLKTPLQPTPLHLSLGSLFSWLACNNYNSTSYTHPPCNSPLCSSFHSNPSCSYCNNKTLPSVTCANNTCTLFPENPITRKTIPSIAITDTLGFPNVSGGAVLVPEFVFSCSDASLLSGLENNVVGLVGLGRSDNSLPAQVSKKLNVSNVFGVCLSGSGVGWYFSGSGIDLASLLIYTPLLSSPVGDTVTIYVGQPSGEYFVNLTSVKVNGQTVNINGTLLTVDGKGFGGTKISTDTPYTVLQSSIYKAFTEAFVNQSSGLNLTVTTPIKPFDVCYQASDVTNTNVGPGVPTVDFVMGSGDDVFWRVFGANSMVRITRNDVAVDVWCLGFVDGGANARTSVVIGGHQLEDNILQFDLESNRLGFSSSLLVHNTSCSEFISK